MKNVAPWFRKSHTNLVDWELHFFRYWSPSVNFCHCDVSGYAHAKGTILTLTSQTLNICNGETCRVDDLLYSAARNKSNFITQSICLG